MTKDLPELPNHARAVVVMVSAIGSTHKTPGKDYYTADQMRTYAAQTVEVDRAARGVPDEMDAIAEKYAHKLALDLECVLADYSGKWWGAAMQTLGAYREAMNAIHERESPTFMGEPLL